MTLATSRRSLINLMQRSESANGDRKNLVNASDCNQLLHNSWAMNWLGFEGHEFISQGHGRRDFNQTNTNIFYNWTNSWLNFKGHGSRIKMTEDTFSKNEFLSIWMCYWCFCKFGKMGSKVKVMTTIDVVK